MPRRSLLCLLLLLVLLALAGAWRLHGSGPAEPVGSAIWWLRVHRSLAAVFVGASLSLAGVFLQCLLRNPLASSDLLGLASGAGLAVLVAVYLGVVGAAGVAAGGLALPVVGLAAVLGAVGALSVTFVLSRRRGVLDPVLLVLTGVAVGIVCSAGIMFVRHLLPYQYSTAADRLLLGAIRDDITTTELAVIGVLTLAGGVSCWRLGPAMDLASLGEDEAASLGVRLGRLRLWMFLWSGILTACSVLLAGPIGFVGLVCPHIMRLVCGPRHRPLALLASCAGAVLVLAADALVRSVELPSGRLPLGVVTALLGGPVFIWMLRRGAADAARH
jgi:iron complex transport system permease protein